MRQVVISHAPQDAGGDAHLAQADDDVVNFVGMLFDYILNDRNLAIPMKALIGRLQLPIVRLAIIDRSFFGKSGHPARQLLNELSSAGHRLEQRQGAEAGCAVQQGGVGGPQGDERLLR